MLHVGKDLRGVDFAALDETVNVPRVKPTPEHVGQERLVEQGLLLAVADCQGDVPHLVQDVSVVKQRQASGDERCQREGEQVHRQSCRAALVQEIAQEAETHGRLEEQQPPEEAVRRLRR